MGFWDRDVEPGLDEMFDLNRDGKIDPGEEGLELAFLAGELDGSADEEEDEEPEDLLLDAGIDLDELADMDPDERREVLEDAGLDPDDFDL